MKSTRGFTIVELLVVIIVIAILASITVVAYNGMTARAHESERAQEFEQIHKSLENFMAINGRYPTMNEIGGTTGAQLIGLTLSAVTPSDFKSANGIQSGWVSSADYGFRYMAWPNPDGSGFQCSSGVCLSYLLQYYNHLTNQSITAKNGS